MTLNEALLNLHTKLTDLVDAIVQSLPMGLVSAVLNFNNWLEDIAIVLLDWFAATTVWCYARLLKILDSVPKEPS